LRRNVLEQIKQSLGVMDEVVASPPVNAAVVLGVGVAPLEGARGRVTKEKGVRALLLEKEGKVAEVS
jgi:hypothetical protein